MRYVCRVCGYVYDEAAEKAPFDSLADSWKCPLCGAPKSQFGPEEAKKVLARISSWLSRHPRAAAVCVAHRANQVPAGFDRVLDLGAVDGYNGRKTTLRRKGHV